MPRKSTSRSEQKAKGEAPREPRQTTPPEELIVQPKNLTEMRLMARQFARDRAIWMGLSS